MSLRFEVNDVFKADLKYCLADHFVDKEGKVIVNKTSLIASPIQSERHGEKARIKSNGYEKIVDIRAIDESRSEALWVIVEEKVEHAGGGTSHVNPNQQQVWSTYSYLAKRINSDGSCHDSGEILQIFFPFIPRNVQLIK